MKKPIGIILWSGKSLLDNERIALIATGIFTKSENQKTGEMIQTYIIRRDMHPMFARRMGEDKSVCGDCKHKEESTCYVNLCHGPIGVFHALVDGSYREWRDSDVDLFRNRNFRIGSMATLPLFLTKYGKRHVKLQMGIRVIHTNGITKKLIKDLKIFVWRV